MFKDAFYLVDNLKIKIEQLLKPGDDSNISPQCRETLELVYKYVDSFEETSKTTLRTDLHNAICSEVYKLQAIVAEICPDVQFLFKAHEYEDVDADWVHFSIDELKLRCVDGLYNSIPDDEEEEDRDGVTSKMIGVCDVYEQLKYSIMGSPVTSLDGMPGIGKTSLANKIFHDPTIVKCFDHRVWVRVGKKYGVKDIPQRILAEIFPDSIVNRVGIDDKVVERYLKAILKDTRYLIVLDDVWDRFATYLLHPFYRYIMHGLDHPFLHPKSGSRILLTSRLQQLSGYGIIIKSPIQMRLLNKEESWDLLREKVFCKGSSCPPQFVKVGKKISKNCEGLPLTILTVARLLLEEKKITMEYWSEVAAKKRHRLFMDAYDEISKVLLPSYTYLPSILQMCFLYIGLFPPNYEIPRPKLFNLWCADRFLELNININSVANATEYLEELVINNLVRVYKKSSITLTHTIKTCGLHSSLWHMSKQKAGETKFALILSNPDDCLKDGIEGHHRLSIQCNVLLAMKDVHTLVEDNCASAACSLLCFGPYLQYQVPLYFRLELLKELDALSIRFYEFPMEVLQLVQLTYLSLTSNGMIPASISQLQFLEFFIVERHQSIKSCRDTSYLPVEIWSLQALKHLQVMGSDLPDPPCDASLDNLTTLSSVSARSCTEVILKGVPNLSVLSIRIELAPNDDGKPFSCFTHVSYLTELRKLKCVIVNPEVVPPVVPISSFQGIYLLNLTLSGLGYPWKEIRNIATLPYLMTLKLKNYAFQGPVWDVEETGFPRLGFLVIEDTNLVDWTLGCGAFEQLMSLTIKNCYKLEKIHGEFSENFRLMELIDCNPSCVAEMKKAIAKNVNLSVHSSWEDGNLKT